VNEDPVTGSAHCCLAPYWAEKLSKNKMKAKQLSQRGGEIAI
jgi:predicted PhzF superfamily epimerase YddE/YHI9